MAAYAKDVVHYGHDPYGTLRGKVHPFLTLGAEMLSNEDYFNRPIRNREDPFIQQLEQSAMHVGAAFQPMSTRNLFSFESTGKHGTFQEIALPFVGITPAPKYITLGDVYQSSGRNTPRGSVRTRPR